MKFRRLRAASAAAVIIVSCIPAVAANAATLPKTGEFDQVEVVKMPGLDQTATSHVVFDGDRYRLESVDTDDDFTPYDDIVDGQSYYHYIPSAHTAVRIALKTKPESTLDSLKDQTQQKIQGLTKTGESVMNGFDCDVYGRDVGSGAKVVLYLSTDPTFPYIIKTIFTVASEGITRSNSIENIKLDVRLGSSEFILPPGTKIVERPAAGGSTQNESSSAVPSTSGAQEGPGPTTK